MLKKISLEQLKEMATMLSEDLRDGAGTVLDNVLSELENRMVEKEFITFCENI